MSTLSRPRTPLGGTGPAAAQPPVSPLHRASWWQLMAAVAVIAFLARLLPVLRSGGLHAINQYDASVYFGAAVGLVHGVIPYRDFLLLHPPGLPVALAPLAALTFVTSDANAMAAARLACMALGALNALLVARILRRLGRFPAVFGALCYALSYPAVTIEQTTRLEGLAATCLLGALALLTGRRVRGASPSTRSVALAGLLLGFSASIKIWQVLPLLVVAIFLLGTAGLARAAQFLLGAAAAGTAVCLPFLLAAPEQMWRYVVTDQLGRTPTATLITTRLADMTGLGLIDDWLGDLEAIAVTAAVEILLISCLLAWRIVAARLAVVLFVVLSLLLLSTPSWLPHYAGLVAAPTAVLLGAAAHTFLAWVRKYGPTWVAVTQALLVGCLVLSAVSLTQADFGRRYYSKEAREVVAELPGCITADDPGTLVQMDVLSRNLRRGCPLSLDLGGYSYDFNPSASVGVRREQDERWQRHALDYLASGSATMVTRYSTSFGFSEATSKTIRSWPVLATDGRYKLRQPLPR